MKTCRGCNETKATSGFYKHKGMADGRLNYCKECVRERVRKRHRRKMLDPEWREKERARNRRKYHNSKVVSQQSDPVKRAANTAVSNAVRDGRLVPTEACEDCGHDFS